MRAQASAALDLAGKPAAVSATGRYASSASALELAVNFDKLEPAAVAAAAPQLSALASIAVPLSGKVDSGSIRNFA